jgi:NAD(P)-dependent dehydrogenase (short-subunit alcohol dehydrogenase family)
VALVTGADRGIGQAIAVTFAHEGADVALHYGHDRQGAEETARQVRALRRSSSHRRWRRWAASTSWSAVRAPAPRAVARSRPP